MYMYMYLNRRNEWGLGPSQPKYPTGSVDFILYYHTQIYYKSLNFRGVGTALAKFPEVSECPIINKDLMKCLSEVKLITIIHIYLSCSYFMLNFNFNELWWWGSTTSYYIKFVPSWIEPNSTIILERTGKARFPVNWGWIKCSRCTS